LLIKKTTSFEYYKNHRYFVPEKHSLFMKKILSLFILQSSLFTFCWAQQTFPVNGTHDLRHCYYAFTHARIFEDYATIVDDGTLLIKDGQIIDIGTDVSIPNEAVVYDCHGKIIYPSFIDLFTDYGMPALKPPARSGNPQMTSATPGAFGWNQAVKSQVDAEQLFHCSPTDASSYRAIGFGTTLSS
jgi:hypothetical protein